MQTEDLLTKIETVMPFLSNAEQKVGRYILRHPNEVLSMSTKALAERSGVSDATLIRFTRRLGVSGYSDFKLILSADLASNESYAIPADVHTDDSCMDIYKKLSAFSVSSIEATSRTLSEKQLQQAAELIYNTHIQNNHIYLSGMGASSILARELQIKLMRLNISSTYFEDIHLQLESNLNMKESDLLICFSTLGKSAQTHQFIDLANEKGANIILITQYGNKKMADKVTVPLFTASVETNLRLASLTAITVQSLVIDTLFLSLALKDLPKIQNDVKDLREHFTKFSYYIK